MPLLQPLAQLKPGTRFLQPDLQITGRLVTVSDSRAVIDLDKPATVVEIEGDDGEKRTFIAQKNKRTSWAARTPVMALPDDEPPTSTEGDLTMAKKSATKKTPKTKAAKPAKVKAEKPAKAAAKATKPPKAAKTPKSGKVAAVKDPAAPKAAKPAADPAATKKLSQLDAAAQVLKAVGRPLNCQEMVSEMESRGLWKSPGGKTPAATLYAALGREIANKGAEARFAKADKGTFGLK